MDHIVECQTCGGKLKAPKTAMVAAAFDGSKVFCSKGCELRYVLTERHKRLQEKATRIRKHFSGESQTDGE